jgi:hypothetical protein
VWHYHFIFDCFLWLQIFASYSKKCEVIDVVLKYFYITRYLHRFIDPRISSFSIGLFGFIISIIGQLIFPAPWRSFRAVSIFAIKQMVDIFLPDWCTARLPLLAIVAIATINISRKKQVPFIRKAYLYNFSLSSYDIYI